VLGNASPPAAPAANTLALTLCYYCGVLPSSGLGLERWQEGLLPTRVALVTGFFTLSVDFGVAAFVAPPLSAWVQEVC